jgi:hypothetical protein
MSKFLLSNFCVFSVGVLLFPLLTDMLLDLKSIYPYSLVLLSVLLTVLPLCSRMIVEVCISAISGKYCEVQVVLYPIAHILYLGNGIGTYIAWFTHVEPGGSASLLGL